MDAIALIPGIISFFVALAFGPEKAFQNVYLPVLLIFPMYLSMTIFGLPDLTFSSSALLGILPTLVLLRLQEWKLCVMDFLILAYLVVITYSEYINRFASYEGMTKTSLSLSFQLVLMPYIMGKLLIHKRFFSTKFSKYVAAIMAINIIICVYEWRMTYNLHSKLLEPFFVEAPLFIPDFRLGLVRITGPFYHPILFGIGIGCALLLSIWLTRNHLWGLNFRSLVVKLPISKPFLINGTLLLGLLATISRGPLLATILALFIPGSAYSFKPYLSLLFRVFALALVSLILLEGTKIYVASGSSRSSSSFASTAAYRVELLGAYKEILLHKPFWGWGSHAHPESGGMKSVDNHYLWLSLKHGLIATGLLILILVWNSIQLLLRGLIIPVNHFVERSLCFTLIAILFMYAVSLLTVYMGAQTGPLLFILLGWSQALLNADSREDEEYLSD